jgi:hypothetical protein
MEGHRPIYVIAEEILRDWKDVSIHANPYLQAMRSIRNIEDRYGLDDADDVILRFLTNAQKWRGESARRIKKELNKMCKDYLKAK